MDQLIKVYVDTETRQALKEAMRKEGSMRESDFVRRLIIKRINEDKDKELEQQ